MKKLAEYDGEIRIKAEIDTKEFNSQANKLSDNLKDQNLLLEKQKMKVKSLQDQYDDLINHVTKSKEEISIVRSLKRAEKELKILEDDYKLAQLAMKTGGTIRNDKGIINKYENISNTINKLKNQLKEIQINPQSAASIKQLALRLELAENESIRLQRNIEKTESRISELGKTSSATSKIFGNFKNAMASFGSQISIQFSKAASWISDLGKRIFRLAASAFVFNVISSGFRNLTRTIWKFIEQDDVLSEYSKRIQLNLITAFSPIYKYVLPALRDFLKILDNLTLKLAEFISALFGQSMAQSQYMAKEMISGLDDSSNSIKNVGKSAKKSASSMATLGKMGKKTRNMLASFDKIEVLKSDKQAENENKKGGLSGLLGINPNKLDPNDIKWIRDAAQNLRDTFKNAFDGIDFNNVLERLKSPLKDLDFSNAINSLKNLKDVLASYGRDAGEDLLWLYENVLSKFAAWSVNNLIPSFIDLLTASLSAIKPVIDQVRDDLKWLWDEFLSKIAEWTGIQIIDAIDGLSDTINKIGTYISNNKPLLEFFSAFLIGLGATALLFGIKSLGKALGGLIWKFVTLTIAMLANPWTWAIIGIAALIAAIILITKHWDEMEKYFGSAYESFKDTITSMKDIFDGFMQNFSGWIDLIAGIFTGDWQRIWKGAANIVGGSINVIIGALNLITSAMNTVMNFVIGGINLLIDKINGFGFDIPDWLGGGSFKLNIPKIPKGFLNYPKIPKVPKLAQGAVLAGGNPMLAYLNDQPKGQVNIETPLNTMVEAFNNAMNNRQNSGNVVIEATGDVGKMISFLNFKLKQEDARVGNSMVKGDVWI